MKVLLVALVQGEDVRAVLLGHGDHGLPGEGAAAGLIDGVSGDGGGAGAGPVQRVPGPVVSQALNGAHVWGEAQNLINETV